MLTDVLLLLDFRSLWMTGTMAWQCRYSMALAICTAQSTSVRGGMRFPARARLSGPPRAYSITRQRLGSCRQTPRRPMMLWCFSMAKSLASWRTLSSVCDTSSSGSRRAAFTATSIPFQMARYTFPKPPTPIISSSTSSLKSIWSTEENERICLKHSRRGVFLNSKIKIL